MSWWAAACLLLSVCLWLPAAAGGQTDFPDVCADDPRNRVDNCGFDDDLDNWHTFLEAGSRPQVSVESAFPDCHSPKCPALRMRAEDWFVGGVYQRVSGVVPGQSYWANVIWLVYDPAGVQDDAVGRQIGIDPTGGTDPRSANVVWSPILWTALDKCPYKICRELQVQAVARSTTLTVFVRIEDTWKNRPAEFPDVPAYFFEMVESFWIDDVGLIPVAAPTPTPLPSPVTAVIEPNTGGRLVSNDAGHSVTVDFPPGAVDKTSVVTYTYQPPPLLVGGLGGTDRFFRLEATAAQLRRPVTVTVRYPAIVPLERDSISLYRLTGETWLNDDITTVRRTATALTSTTSHLGTFGLLGETHRVYIPSIMK